MSLSSLAIILMYFKGRLGYMIGGSILFDYGLLEVAGLIIFLNTVFKTKKEHRIKHSLILIGTGIIMFFIFECLTSF